VTAIKREEASLSSRNMSIDADAEGKDTIDKEDIEITV
jgi:hypothetical protein